MVSIAGPTSFGSCGSRPGGLLYGAAPFDLTALCSSNGFPTSIMILIALS